MEQTKRIDYWYITDPDKDWKGYRTTEITEDPSYALSKMCEETTFEQLPAQDVERAKKALLDTIAVMMEGSASPLVTSMKQAEKPFLTGGESKVFFYGDDTTAIEAAVLNGAMAAAPQRGDVHVTGGTVSEFIVPTLLTAVSLFRDKFDKTVTGKEYLTAYICGAEWDVRHHSCLHYMEHNLGTPGNLGFIADAAAAGKMLGMDALRIVNACGFTFCSNTWGEGESLVEDTDARQINRGIYGSDALMGVLLAYDGLTSPTAFYFGKSGYLRYTVWDDIEPELLTKDLGKEWTWTKGLKYRPVAGRDLSTLVDEMSWEELEDKLRAAAAVCVKKYTDEELAAIVNFCKKADEAADMGALTALLA